MISYQKLFAYEAWANRQALNSLRRCGEPPAQALRTMAHILGASLLWHSRIQGTSTPLAVWPDLQLQQFDPQINRLDDLWNKYLSELTPDRLNQQIDYVNSKGERWTNTVDDILTHVLMHSGYHRGQVAMLLRMSSNEPAYTDYIHAVRQGILSS